MGAIKEHHRDEIEQGFRIKTAEEFYNEKFRLKKITVVSKHTAIELMESYAKSILEHGKYPNQ